MSASLVLLLWSALICASPLVTPLVGAQSEPQGYAARRVLPRSAGPNADEPTGAILITQLPNTFYDSPDTLPATSNGSDPTHSCTGSRDEMTMWYRYVADYTGTFAVTTLGSTYDTILTIYPGTSAPGAELACSDNFSGTSDGFVSIPVAAGQSYLIEVSAKVRNDGRSIFLARLLFYKVGVKGPSKVGVYSNGIWILDGIGDGLWRGPGLGDLLFGWGSPADDLILGDWTGSGTTKIGTCNTLGGCAIDLNGNTVWDWHLRPWDESRAPGCGGLPMVIGDWLGTGTDKLGCYGHGSFRLDSNGDLAFADTMYFETEYLNFAPATALPVVGDWTGSGSTKVGYYYNGLFCLDKNGNGVCDPGPAADLMVMWGPPDATPVIGDWNGDGRAKIGVFKAGLWMLDGNGNGVWDGPSGGDYLFVWGRPGDTPVLGDWNGDGRTKIGVFNNGLWILDKNGNRQWEPPPGGDLLFMWGQPGDRPVVGRW